MKSTKIRFEDDTYRIIKEYLDSTGMSLQGFVTLSIRRELDRVELEQEIKDQELLSK